MVGSLFIFSQTAHLATISEFIGQVTSIIFAFYTNKKWVFHHESNHPILDFFNFALGRVAFMILAIALKYWLGDLQPNLLMKLTHLNFTNSLLLLSLLIQFANILLNYLYSKFLVFRRKKV